MRNMLIASAILAGLAGGTAAWADDSGHAGPMSLKAEQSIDNGTIGKTTETHTAGDATATPGARHAMREKQNMEANAPRRQ